MTVWFGGGGGGELLHVYAWVGAERSFFPFLMKVGSQGERR